MSDRSDVSILLAAAGNGDRRAEERLFSRVYHELHGMAQRKMRREKPGLTLQPTALVHEAYLRMVKNENVRWENRAHFFGAAAEAMRRILVERARKSKRLRHDPGGHRVPLEDCEVEEPSVDILALDEALTRLEGFDPRKSRVVKHRFYLRMTVEETAETLGIGERAVYEDWRLAKAWLSKELLKANGD